MFFSKYVSWKIKRQKYYNENIIYGLPYLFFNNIKLLHYKYDWANGIKDYLFYIFVNSGVQVLGHEKVIQLVNENKETNGNKRTRKTRILH